MMGYGLHVSPSVLAALGAAALFGGSTPLVKPLAGDLPAMLLAGLLYLGSGLGVSAMRCVRDRGWRHPGMARHEWPWLWGAIGCGGVVGPTLLLLGLANVSAATASLLLNLEAVLTAVLAWIVFQEHADRRIVLGMFFIVVGGVVLSWPSADASARSLVGPLCIAGACLCWAIDNNLTRHVAAADALFLAGTKGIVAGAVNVGLALLLGASLPSGARVLSILGTGFLSYGMSLVLFVLALRGLGTARTGAYFSTAPFIGAVIALVVWREPTSARFWLAAVCMGGGVWLHLTEQHAHEHWHDVLEHHHRHVHDVHHQHEHAGGWDGQAPHSHAHAHQPVTHSHPHYPDIHHRHPHTWS